MKTEHTQFTGSIPENYDKYIGPLLFEPYALDIVERVDVTKVKSALEIACGTGRVTRQLINHLLPGATLIATDLNGGMISVAQQQLQYPNLRFVAADAQQLPFDDDSFDLVVCQFGYMFVPDKQQAFNEAYRVLKSGGTLLFNTWDSLQQNQSILIVKNVVAAHLSKAAADFYNVPFSMYDHAAIEALLKASGFKDIQIAVVSKEGTHVTAKEAARGLILGTPAFKIISDNDASAPARLVDIASKALAQSFGDGIIKTELNAVVCKAIK